MQKNVTDINIAGVGDETKFRFYLTAMKNY